MKKARSPIWHPFTQHALAPEFPVAVRAEGAWLETKDGRRIFDGISSWWVVTHGHSHPHIVAAIREQAERLDQVIFANLTHEPAERLATALLARVNGSLAQGQSDSGDGKKNAKALTHVFFSDSGSTSVEVALKMALGFWRNRGETRHRIAALEHGYHGDTIGTMSAGARGIFNAAYEPLLFDVVRLPLPSPGNEQETLDALEKSAKQDPLAAIVVEPLILGAGGMLIYPAATLREMKRICEHYGTLFIADEVMTGFGRTGTFTACEQASISPDILCLAKGITGGSLPLAVTLATQEIFDAHFAEDRAKTFFHSSSYTANPIACAAAVANMDIWDNEPVPDRVAALERLQSEHIKRLEDEPALENGRLLGTIAAVDVKVTDAGYLSDIGPRLAQHFMKRGVLLRPLGNTIYVMPPYCSTANDLGHVYGVICEGVKAHAQ